LHVLISASPVHSASHVGNDEVERNLGEPLTAYHRADTNSICKCAGRTQQKSLDGLKDERHRSVTNRIRLGLRLGSVGSGGAANLLREAALSLRRRHDRGIRGASSLGGNLVADLRTAAGWLRRTTDLSRVSPPQCP